MTPLSDADPLPDGTCLGRAALRVSDLAEVTDFYRNVVGLEVRRQDATTATLGVAGAPLLVLTEEGTARERRQPEAGLYHNAFRVPTRGALGDALRRVRDRWRLDGASDHRHSEALYFTDPEGNGVEVYRDFPRDEWPRTDDEVRLFTDPLDLDTIEAAAAGDDLAPAGTDLGHVHLEVSSLDAFREFYANTLGFEVHVRTPEVLFVSAGGYHHHVAANTWNNRTEPAAGRGLSWFEVVVPDPDVLATVRERLADSGTPIAETDDGFAVTAPDGIEVRLRSKSPPCSSGPGE